MFCRFFLFSCLICLGIGSPWLVQDWLERRSGESKGGRISAAVAAFPAKLKKSLGRSSAASGAAAPETATAGEGAEGGDSTGSTRPPYPLASKARRLVQGFLPGGSAPRPAELSANPRVAAAGERTAGKTGKELAKLGLATGDPVFVRIFKEEEELELWMQGEGNDHFTLYKVYPVRHWSGKLGPKRRDGDGQGPEGFYHVPPSQLRPETRHHLGMDLGYPNDYDRYHGRTGGGLMIHGGAGSAGSYALSPDDIDEVYTLAVAALASGQPSVRVNAFPFRMTDQRMEREWQRQPEWIEFWTNLKEGYDFFENVNRPPAVEVEAGKYAFRIR